MAYAGRDLEREKREHFNRHTLPALIRELNAVDTPTKWYIKPATEVERENGEQWRNPTIINMAGESLSLHVDGYGNENRVEVSGNYGQLPSGDNWYVSGFMGREHKDPKAGMSLEKTPKAMAKDIHTRVLRGGYRFYRAEYLKRVKEQTDRNDGCKAMAEKLVKESGGAFTIRPDYQGRNNGKKGELTLDSHVKALYDITADADGFTCQRLYVRESDIPAFVEFCKQLARRD